jgi:hypothetical protein
MSQPHRPDTSGFKLQRSTDEVMDFIDELLASANPNPTRKDCLSLEEINEMANHKRPLDDPGYTHMQNCSPCYRELRAIRQVIEKRGIDPQVVQ